MFEARQDKTPNDPPRRATNVHKQYHFLFLLNVENVNDYAYKNTTRSVAQPGSASGLGEDAPKTESKHIIVMFQQQLTISMGVLSIKKKR